MALWSERYQPTTESELVVGKKKIDQVREFFALGSTRRILVLKGPPGCGKATVLRALCNDLGLEVVEWSPASRGQVRRGSVGASAQGAAPTESRSADFLRFLAQTDRYRALPDPSCGNRIARRRVSLVRDFPFTLVQSRGDAVRPAEFLDNFHSLANNGTIQRAVFCFNDSGEDYKIVTKLFAPVDSSVINSVNFDGVPRTFAQRALDGISKSLAVKPASAGTAEIAAECGGDLRHAINALQLVIGGARQTKLPEAKNGRAPTNGRATNGRSTNGRGRGKSATAGTVSTIAAHGQAAVAQGSPETTGLRGASLGLFHALGRLLYNKRIPPADSVKPDVLADGTAEASQPAPKRRKKEKDPTEPRQLPHEMLVPKARRPPLYFKPEEVLASSGSEPASVTEWLFTNAPRFYGDVEDLAEFTATLACTDAWDQHRFSHGGGSSSEASGPPWDTLGAEVQARGLLDANLHPVQPSFGDACSALAGTAEGPAFNMVRPLLRDTERLRQRRMEALSTSLEMVGPEALGSVSAGSSALIRTFPFVHLMLTFSMGQHRTLQHLPHSLMRQLMELSAFDGSALRRGEEALGKDRADVTSEMEAAAAAAEEMRRLELPDDPIESF